MTFKSTLASLPMRPMINRDFPAIIRIERASFAQSLSESNLLALHQQIAISSMVVLSDSDEIIGYVIYRLARRVIEIERLAVTPKHRRSRIGSALIERLKEKLSTTRRRRIMATSSIENISVARFFAANCFESRCAVFDGDQIEFTYELWEPGE